MAQNDIDADIEHLVAAADPSAGDRGGVAEIMQTRAVRAGLVGDFNGHSLRRGFITEAVRSGTISLQVIRETTLHASLDSMLGYVAAARRFDNKIGVSLGL